jgi:hypothetical protein
VISDKAMRGGPGEVEEDRQVDRWIGRWTDGQAVEVGEIDGTCRTLYTGVPRCKRRDIKWF